MKIDILNNFKRKFQKIILFNKAIKLIISNHINNFIYKEHLPIDLRQDDLYVVEFPKSGITWLTFILVNIYLTMNNSKKFITFFNYPFFICEKNYEKFNNSEMRSRIIKSHSHYNPYYSVVIYLLRNPFDVMVSYYNFTINLSGYKGDFFKFVKSKKYGIQSWKEHVISWIKVTDQSKRIHILRYEDLLKNTYEEIKNIVTNLGLVIDDSIIKQAIEQSSIENMKKTEEFYRKHSPNYTVSFIGKEGKIPKEKLLTDDIKQYILKETEDILERFYPELLK